MKLNKKIVCLGGGIGTVNLIRGLKTHVNDITVVVSMADEGGSSGRLRRLYNIHPPGDLVSCMAALSRKTKFPLCNLLTYRFPGDRYGSDEALGGQKLGNLLMVALRDITGSFDKAVEVFQKMFNIPGKFLSATSEAVTISAITSEGKEIVGEETIDLGKYNGERVLEKVILHPENVRAGKGVLESIKNADVIIAGPGDLYTTILPVLLVKDISKAVIESSAHKIFIVNVANKPFETKGYCVEDYVKAVTKHLGIFPFKTLIVNSNHKLKIPKKYHYTFVLNDKELPKNINILEKDLADKNFPLYHDSKKLAKVVYKAI